MKIQAVAGKRILTEQRDDDSPVLVLNSVDVAEGHEEFSPIAELDMSGIFEQVMRVVTGA